MSFTPALAQRLFPTISIPREIAKLVAGAALIAVLAQLRIELRPVPVTGQTLGVLLTGAFLGFRRGIAATTLYVGMGLAGLPVFAGTGVGLAVLTGATGGYLIGFVLSAGTIGLLAEHGFLDGYGRTALAMVVATIPVFVVGLAWLFNFIAAKDAFEAGFVVFIPGAIAKIAIATAITGRSVRRRA